MTYMNTAATDFTNLISSELFAAGLEAYQLGAVLDAIFGEGVQGTDYSQPTQPFKAPTGMAMSYDGKAKVIRVPIEPAETGDTSTLAETGAPTELQYTPSYVDVTVAEIGNFVARISGLAQLQTFDSATARIFRGLVRKMQDTKERLILAKALAGGTKRYSESADTVQYFQIDPVDQGASVYKPAGMLSSMHLEEGMTLLEDAAEPFDNGLYMGYIHPECKNALLAMAGDKLETFQNYQSGSPFPSNQRMGCIGVYKGVMWFPSRQAALKVASGAADGTAAYKTLVFGKHFLAKGLVPPQYLPLADTSMTQIPIGDFVIRQGADKTDQHGRAAILSPYGIMGYKVALKPAGLYIVSRSNWSTTTAANVA